MLSSGFNAADSVCSLAIDRCVARSLITRLMQLNERLMQSEVDVLFVTSSAMRVAFGG